MADIASSTIGEELRSAQDYLFQGEATPANTNVISAAKPLGRTQDTLEIVIDVATTVNITDTKVLTIEYFYDEAIDGSFTNSVTLYTVTASGATALAVGELARFAIPISLPTFGKVKITTDDALVDGTLDVYPIFVAR